MAEEEGEVGEGEVREVREERMSTHTKSIHA